MSGKRFISLITVVVLIIGLMSMATATVVASHFRSTQLTWTTTSGTTAEFHSVMGVRRSFYGAPVLGDTIFPTSIFFGDSSSASPAHTVIAVDAANDWILVEATFTHTYAGSGPFTVRSDTCCRLSGPQHINNPDGNNRAETIVDFASTPGSPVSSISPIVDCALNALCQFSVPAFHPGGQSIQYRFATSSEADGFTPFTQPGPPHATNAATIDSATGLYSWNTTGATLNTSGGDTFYSTQVMVEALVGNVVVTKTPVDFFIRLTTSPNQAPAFTSPTPTDATVIDTTVGSLVTFDVAAADPDTADTVTLNMLGKPADATYSTTAGNPATGTFSWTPSATGTVILTLTAQDQHGLGATQRSVTINVTSGPTNTPPTVSITDGPTAVDESASQEHAYAFSITDADAGDSWSFVNGYPTCGTGGDLVPGSDSIDQVAMTGDFRCIFDDGTSTPTVAVKVEDAEAAESNEATRGVTVANVAPTATAAVSSANAFTGVPLMFSFAATDPSNADTAAGFEWRFDDGQGGGYGAYGAPQTGAFNPIATYTDCGTYTATAQARDKDGGESNEPQVVVTLADATFHGAVVPAQVNLVQKGRVIPVQIRIGCDGAPLTGLSPSIQLLRGDIADIDESDTANHVVTESVSNADTTGVMRAVDGGYIYNLQIPSTATKGQNFTVRVSPWGYPGPSLYAVIEIRK